MRLILLSTQNSSESLFIYNALIFFRFNYRLPTNYQTFFCFIPKFYVMKLRWLYHSNLEFIAISIPVCLNFFCLIIYLIHFLQNSIKLLNQDALLGYKSEYPAMLGNLALYFLTGHSFFANQMISGSNHRVRHSTFHLTFRYTWPIFHVQFHDLLDFSLSQQHLNLTKPVFLSDLD